jgi:hypothetical protein
MELTGQANRLPRSGHRFAIAVPYAEFADCVGVARV